MLRSECEQESLSRYGRGSLTRLWSSPIIPALVEYIRPSDEELRKRYNPDLQKRAAEQGDRRAQEFESSNSCARRSPCSAARFCRSGLYRFLSSSSEGRIKIR
jgi:hypothetical protein